MHHQQIGIARRQQARTHADRRHRKKRVGRRLNRVRQLHAAHRIVLRCAEHAGGRVGLLRVMRRLRQNHFFTVEVRFLRINGAVEGRVLFTRDALTGVKHGTESLTRMVGKALALVQ